jgi:hypothetical protein
MGPALRLTVRRGGGQAVAALGPAVAALGPAVAALGPAVAALGPAVLAALGPADARSARALT